MCVGLLLTGPAVGFMIPAALHDLRGLSLGSGDLMLMACDPPQFPASGNVPLQPQLPRPPQAGDPRESSLSQRSGTGKLNWLAVSQFCSLSAPVSQLSHLTCF